MLGPVERRDGGAHPGGALGDHRPAEGRQVHAQLQEAPREGNGLLLAADDHRHDGQVTVSQDPESQRPQLLAEVVGVGAEAGPQLAAVDAPLDGPDHRAGQHGGERRRRHVRARRHPQVLA